MKKWMRTSGVLAALSILCIGSTVYQGELSDAAAYLSHRDTTVNQTEVGYNESHVDETFTPPGKVDPNKEYSKTVKVKNTTDGACYVRVLVEFSDSTAAASINFDTRYWTTKQADGYYYYKTALGSQEVTQPLFSKVTTGNTNQSFEVIVYEETVQARGYATPQEAFAAVRVQ